MIFNSQIAEGGITLPILTNPGTSSDVLSGKQLINGDGEIVTGNIVTVTQATPSITVSSTGLITASSTQSTGYVASGTKSTTKQLTTKSTTTYTPTTSNQTISSGTYLTGTQTIKGDSNLLAANIKSGVSIFGVAGSYTGDNNAYFVSRSYSTDTNGTLTFTGLPFTPSFMSISCNNYLFNNGTTGRYYVFCGFAPGDGTSMYYCYSLDGAESSLGQSGFSTSSNTVTLNLAGGKRDLYLYGGYTYYFIFYP